MVATRQLSKKKPRTYRDYREMLKEKDLDIVLIGTPDHWHALPMIAAAKAGADIYVQKPISVDVVEGQAMLAAARKHGRVVQVGTQRRSTPHLIEARDRVIRKASWARSASWKFAATTTCAPPAIRRTPRRRPISITKCGPARRPCARTIACVHPRGWRAFMEYGNGIVGDMCVHMLDMVRWMIDLGWPNPHQLHRRHSGGQGQQGRTSPTRRPPRLTFGDLQVVWQHRTWGEPPDPKYPWACYLLRRQRHAQGQRLRLRLHPHGRRRARPSRRDLRVGTISRRQNRKRPGAARRSRRIAAT